MLSPRNQTQGGEGRGDPGRWEGASAGDAGRWGASAGPARKAPPQCHGRAPAGQDAAGHRTSRVRGRGVGCMEESSVLRSPTRCEARRAGICRAGQQRADPRKGSVFPRGRAAFSSCVLQWIGDWMGPTAGWRVQNTEEISAGLCPQFPLRTYLIPCKFLGDKSVICPNEVSLGGLLGGSWSPE